MIHRIEKARQDAYEIFYQNSHVPGRYAAYIRGTRCATDAGFLKEISAAMQFPDYFGENWNAWEECMTDLDWLSFSSIALVIDDYEVLFEEEKEPEKKSFIRKKKRKQKKNLLKKLKRLKKKQR